MSNKNVTGLEIGYYAIVFKKQRLSLSEAFELSPRESQALLLFIRGMTGPQISARMNISANTLSTFRRRIFAKLGVKNMTGAVALAVACLSGARIISLEPEPVSEASLRKLAS